ncbi:spliceosome-associated protein CWC27 homolog [Pieris napi]|uniref:spliceosome-associated protein CWC27 homolog n=1 Tax=Pieris napi TaxID=78633 RepID=UPI001FB8A6DF|nr:spliceosome-associated protein CWC27 homolog [Pieris napi]
MTISKYESSDLSKTKSDSTLLTQDTVIERDRSRRISETVVDMSYIKSDLEDIFEEAILRVCELQMMEDDTMSEQEDVDNYNTYTKPPQYSLPYSIELSDILEEDETSGLDRISIQAKECAEELMKFIEDKLQKHFDDSSGPSTEEFSREFDLSPSQKSQSLVDLRNIPDLPPSLIIKPKVIRVDKSTSTSEDSIDRKTDSSSMTEDKSERTERVLDKLESLHRFFSRSRLEIIDESLEDDRKSPKGRKHYASLDDVEDLAEDNDRKSPKGKKFQASLDDVEDLAEDNDRKSPKGKKFQASLDDVEDLAEDNDRRSPRGKKGRASQDNIEDLAEDNDRKSPRGKKFQASLDDVEDLAEDNDRKSPKVKKFQASLDDLEDLAEDNDRKSPRGKKGRASQDNIEDLAEDNDRKSPRGKKFQASLDDLEDLAEDNDRKSPRGKKGRASQDNIEDLAEDNDRKNPKGKKLQARLDDVEDLAEDNDRIDDVDQI